MCSERRAAPWSQQGEEWTSFIHLDWPDSAEITQRAQGMTAGGSSHDYDHLQAESSPPLKAEDKAEFVLYYSTVEALLVQGARTSQVLNSIFSIFISARLTAQQPCRGNCRRQRANLKDQLGNSEWCQAAGRAPGPATVPGGGRSTESSACLWL